MGEPPDNETRKGNSMRKLTLALAATLAALAGATAFSGSANADPYKWCAEYSGGRGGATNCYFVTFAQCRAALSGDNAGFCRRNTFYTGNESRYSGHDRRGDWRRYN
jgi:hypothetical protein